MANANNNDPIDFENDDFYSILNGDIGTNEVINNWNNYSSNIPSQITTMWNFMLYNQFNNEEIRRLQRHNQFLENDLERCNTDYSLLTTKCDNLQFENIKIKRKLRDIEEENDEKSNNPKTVHDL